VAAPLTALAPLWRRIGLGLRELWSRPYGRFAAGALSALLAMGLFALLRGAPSLPARSSFFAVLTDSKTLRPVLVISAGRRDSQLAIRTLDPAIHVSSRSLELWALPKGRPPRSLGVVEGVQDALLQLPADADVSLSDVPILAVSVEPKGGSLTGAPTGPVLYSGPCVKYW